MLKQAEQPPTRSLHRPNLRATATLLLILAVVTAIRIRLLNFPLERDEGEFAYAAQLLLDGISPYQGAYNVALKLPGTCVAYAAIFSVLGQTTAAIHVGLILVNLATAWLVFLFSRRVCGDWPGVVAAGTYALLSLSPATFGLSAHATHFVMLPALAGIVLVQNPADHASRGRIFWAGLLFGIAVLMKQTGAAFGLFAAVWVARCNFGEATGSRRQLFLKLIWLATGGLLPLALTCLIISVRGEFGQFWFWGFEYARAHAAIIPFSQSVATLLITSVRLFADAPGLWALAAAGLVLMFREPALQRWRSFILGFTFFSFVAVWPGWREHYFVQLLPATGLLVGVAMWVMLRKLAQFKLRFHRATIPVLLWVGAAAALLAGSSDILFWLTPARASRALYGVNPFPEAMEAGHYLAQHCRPQARIAVLGSEPEIYFYSRRRAATGFICTYPLMEPQPQAEAMQQQMIREIEAASPDYVVYVNVRDSWLEFPGASHSIYDWFARYREEHLRLVGLMEILPNGRTEIQWFNPQEAVRSPSSKYWLAIYVDRSITDPAPK